MNWSTHPIKSFFGVLAAVLGFCVVGMIVLRYGFHARFVPEHPDFAVLMLTFVICFISYAGLWQSINSDEHASIDKPRATNESLRLEVVSSIAGHWFAMSTEPGASALKKEEYKYERGEVLYLSPHKTSDMGRVTHWLVRSKHHPNIVITEEIFALWRVECVRDRAEAA